MEFEHLVFYNNLVVLYFFKVFLHLLYFPPILKLVESTPVLGTAGQRIPGFLASDPLVSVVAVAFLANGQKDVLVGDSSGVVLCYILSGYAGNAYFLTGFHIVFVLFNALEEFFPLVILEIQAVTFLNEGLVHNVIFHIQKSHFLFLVCVHLL